DMNELVAGYSDAGTYLGPAQNLIDQKGFLNNKGKPEISRTPGYPVFVAGIMLLVGRDMRAVLIVQTIILSFGPIILYWLARQTLPPIMAIIAGLIGALSPWAAVLTVAPLSDGLFLFLLTLIFFLLSLMNDLPRAKALLTIGFIGLLTGLAIL